MRRIGCEAAEQTPYNLCWRWMRGIGVALLAATLVAPTTYEPRHSLAAESPQAPNVLIILADDLGYSDVGCYGGEIATPNLDALAADGLRFTQFYNTARCWPTRGALLTGYYAQQIRRDTVPGVPSGGRGQRPEWAPLLSEMLKPLGYRSYHSGKWHVDRTPLACGFDRSYLLQDSGRFFSPKVHFKDDVKLPPVEPGSGYYSTTAIADHTIEFLKEHAEKHHEQPFFHYLAFLAPHFPLHALQADIDRYRDVYRRDWEQVRQERWRRQKEMGLVWGELSAVEREVGPPYHFPESLQTLGRGEVNRPLPVSELTNEQREFQAAKMAIHAAMIDRMDREIGRVLDQLRAMNAFDNTLICFLSDNGASAEIMVRDDGHDPSAPPGSAATHLCLGPVGSTVSNTPFRRHKTWVHEGGIATPLIVHWPKGIEDRGQLRHTPGHVIDLAPTILEIAGSPRNRPQPEAGSEQNPATPPWPGRSLVPTFARGTELKRDYLWWLHEGNRAIRIGDWKLVAAANGAWELFNLKTDRAETKNLATGHPDKVRELEQAWNQRWEEFQHIARQDAPTEEPATKPAKRQAAVKELILPGESFLIEGRPAFILLPPTKKRQSPQPWVFYAPTLPAYPDQHEKWMHEQFLAAGVAVAGIDVGESYGSPQGRELFSAFYREMTERRNYARKPCLLGRSRGGLWVTSWAIENPDKVAGIAGIYPVLDFRTYPGVEKAASAYGVSPQELTANLTKFNPIEQVGVLAKARVPAFIIHGDQDFGVPLKENSAEFVKRYQMKGAADAVELIVAEGQGHNFWEGFFRCQDLVDFVIARAHAGAKSPS